MSIDTPSGGRYRHAEAIARTFDGWVRDGTATGMERRHKRLTECMLERITMTPHGRVLDIGCGDGWTVRLISKRVPQGAVLGIDLSHEMILQARLASVELDNVLFAPAPAEEIPWAGDYFTHIVSIESAYYWPDPSLAAREMFRVAAHGGSFHILINYYEENPFSAGWDQETGLALHRLSALQWVDVFADVGFEDISTDRIPDDSPISPGKAPAVLAKRQGLQDVGALYVTGSKPALAEPANPELTQPRNPFPVLR